MRLDHYAAASVRLVGIEDNMLLSAFGDGVNAAIAQLAWVPVCCPVEFGLLGYSPEPWQPVDTFAVLKLMALQLGMNAKYKALMHELGRAFSADAVDTLGARATAHDYATLTGAALARDAIDVPIRAFGQPLDLSGLPPVLGQAGAPGSKRVAAVRRVFAAAHPPPRTRGANAAQAIPSPFLQCPSLRATATERTVIPQI
ncbi:hypothetical protein WS69_07300 [Burkholderia sp. BDU5]|nr:hypothetical protein WS69_07300 [Burkholderia sp. BDU5]